MKFAYLLVNFFTVIVPFLFSFHKKLRFNNYFRPFFKANLIISSLFIAWDIVFTKMGVWGFNPDYLTEIYFFNLPIEEVLFFVCIPFSCVFTYHCLNIFYKYQWSVQFENFFILTFALLLLGFGLYFNSKLYPSYTFISLSFILIILKFYFKVNWFAKIICIYPILLIPFFIVNGVLTGTGLDHPIVWYNPSENIGLRLLTIPVEDVFYGFELIILNIFLYEYFKNKFSIIDSKKNF